MKTAISISSIAIMLCLAFNGQVLPRAPSLGQQYCSERFSYCVDFPTSMFAHYYVSPDEDSLVLRTADSLGLVTVLSTRTPGQKLNSHLLFDQRLKALAAPNGTPNVLSIINGEDYYEASFLCGNHWYRQKAGFFRNYDVLFTIRVPVNRPELMTRMKEDVDMNFD